VSVLGVITARGGSKGIPGKNLKLLGGRPLIAYTIDAARQSGALDRLILSTDDPAIAEVGRSMGCEVPFIRPADLALDQTPHLPVMQHAVEWLAANDGYRPDLVLILQPTSPLRRAEHVREAVSLAQTSGADSVGAWAPCPSTTTRFGRCGSTPTAPRFCSSAASPSDIATSAARTCRRCGR